MYSPALALDGLRPSASNSPPPHQHQNMAGLSSPTSRASLLSGLRTGGVRSPSPMAEQHFQDQQQEAAAAGEGSPTSSYGPSSPNNSAYARRLKASAAIFTPNSPLAQKILNGQDALNMNMNMNMNMGRGSPNGNDSPKPMPHGLMNGNQSPQGSPVQNRQVNGGNRNINQREMAGLEDQMVALRMQALAEQNAANVAAMYGAARGQPREEQENQHQLRMQQQQQQHQQVSF